MRFFLFGEVSGNECNRGDVSEQRVLFYFLDKFKAGHVRQIKLDNGRAEMIVLEFRQRFLAVGTMSDDYVFVFNEIENVLVTAFILANDKQALRMRLNNALDAAKYFL